MGHLVIGFIAGFILYEFLHDRNCIIFCALGSVLPDIIDKPLGHFFLISSLDNGKIFFHSLVIFLLFCFTGYLVWRHYHSLSFLCVAAGILVHQLADLMWKRPVNWYYPLLGRYKTETHQNYFSQALSSEMGSPTEWIFLLALMVIAVLCFIGWLEHRPVPEPDPLVTSRNRQLWFGLLATGLLVLGLSVLIIIIWQPAYAS